MAKVVHSTNQDRPHYGATNKRLDNTDQKNSSYKGSKYYQRNMETIFRSVHAVSTSKGDDSLYDSD